MRGEGRQKKDLCNINQVWCVHFFPVPMLIYPQLKRYFSIFQRTTYSVYSYFMLQFFLLRKLNHANTSALQWWRPTKRLDKQSQTATVAAAVVQLSELNRCEGWGLSLWISNAHWHRLHPQHATALCHSDGEQLAWRGEHAEGEHSLRAGRQLHPSTFLSHPDQCSCVTSQRHIQRDNNHPLPVPMPSLGWILSGPNLWLCLLEIKFSSLKPKNNTRNKTDLSRNYLAQYQFKSLA